MGNFASSCIAPTAASVLGTDGALHRIEIPAGVADLMIESPGHIVARAEEVRRTRRACGMRPEEQLRPGMVYLLLPVNRVGSRLSDRQMEVLIGAIDGGGKGKGKRRSSSSSSGALKRVFPEITSEEEDSIEGEKGILEGKFTGLPGQRVGGYRHWKPALDTIPEF